MIDYITLGSTPVDEPCAQVGTNEYWRNSQAEGKAYIQQLKRINGDPPPGIFFRMKGFEHDFGTYHEVIVEFSTSVPEHIQYARECEHKMPQNWDEEAKQLLADSGYPFGPLEKAEKK